MSKLYFDFYDWQEFELFLDSLPTKIRAKLTARMDDITEYGLSIAIKMKWIKKLDTNLFEIRSDFGNNIQRAIYFHYEHNRYVVTQGFIKKSQKTPLKEIKKAKRRKNEYYHRKGHQ